MSRWIVAVVLLVSGLTAIMPIGLCPCWLMADLRTQHPHLSDPEQRHPHDYLVDLFQAQEAASPPSLISVQDWLAAAESASFWQTLAGHPLSIANWSPAIEPPPPRG